MTESNDRRLAKLVYDNIMEIEEAITAARRMALKDAVDAALAAKLPEYFQWGPDAMEHFNIGKKRAAEEIKTLESAA